jgi:hypothetical protein
MRLSPGNERDKVIEQGLEVRVSEGEEKQI